MPRDEDGIDLLDARREPWGDAERVTLDTTGGSIAGRLHDADGDRAVVWVFGAGGGLDGPAGGLYPRLAGRLRPEGIASLEVAYRRPAELVPCILDVLAGIAFLEVEGKARVALVGHSFGGAVVVNAGIISDAVVAVAALSGQTAGTSAVGRLSPKPALFVHGEADEVLPAGCSRDLFARAGEPRRLILYPGCRHGLDECRDALDGDLTAWLRQVLEP